MEGSERTRLEFLPAARQKPPVNEPDKLVYALTHYRLGDAVMFRSLNVKAVVTARRFP